jgi:hypothetical protein
LSIKTSLTRRRWAGFTGFLKAVILRISEAKDLSESDRFKFHEHMKTYTAAPPDVLRHRVRPAAY